MHPAFWYEFPPLVRGCSAFLATWTQMDNLFKGKNLELWERMRFITDCGVPVVSIIQEDTTVYLFDAEQNLKIEIPPYPTKLVDPIGEYHSFCGAFAGGFFKDFNSMTAALKGSVTAGIKSEGSTPRYVFNVLPELARRRVDSLTSMLTTH